MMKSRVLLLIGICFTGLIVNGQLRVTALAFHSHTEFCHLIGTTETDEVLELLSDSTVSISAYSSSFIDQYETVRKLTFSGRFSQRDDTLFVVYTGRTEVVKSENKTDTLTTTPINNAIFCPSSIIVISDETATGIDKPLSLNKIAVEKIKLLHSRFQFWDKRVSSKNGVVFGLDD